MDCAFNHAIGRVRKETDIFGHGFVAANAARCLAAAEGPLQRTVQLDNTLWRSWNGLGMIADSQHDWNAADAAYNLGLTAGAAPSDASKQSRPLSDATRSTRERHASL